MALSVFRQFYIEIKNKIKKDASCLIEIPETIKNSKEREVADSEFGASQ